MAFCLEDHFTKESRYNTDNLSNNTDKLIVNELAENKDGIHA